MIAVTHTNYLGEPIDPARRKSMELGRDGKTPIFAAAGYGASLTPISEDGAGGISSPITERGNDTLNDTILVQVY